MLDIKRYIGKVVLVTGSGTGIGRGIALRFAREGASIVGVDIDKELLNLFKNDVSAIGARALTILADASREEDVKRSVKEALGEFKRIDVLANNVGGLEAKPLMRMEENDWVRTLDINAKTTFMWSIEVGKQMISQRSGAIINIASDSGKVGDPNSGAYAAAKHAVLGLTKNFALELAPYGIRVNAILPGWIETRMSANTIKHFAALSNRLSEDLRKEIVSTIPLGRFGLPDDIAGVAAFLASDDAGYMTGQSINVTGGLLML